MTVSYPLILEFQWIVVLSLNFHNDPGRQLRRCIVFLFVCFEFVDCKDIQIFHPLAHFPHASCSSCIQGQATAVLSARLHVSRMLVLGADLELEPRPSIMGPGHPNQRFNQPLCPACIPQGRHREKLRTWPGSKNRTRLHGSRVLCRGRDNGRIPRCYCRCSYELR